MSCESGTICNMDELVQLPDNALVLADVLGAAVDVPASGRLELVYDESRRCTDAWIKPRNERRTPDELKNTTVFCSCLINTSVVKGRCVICGRAKRPASNEG